MNREEFLQDAAVKFIAANITSIGEKSVILQTSEYWVNYANSLYDTIQTQVDKYDDHKSDIIGNEGQFPRDFSVLAALEGSSSPTPMARRISNCLKVYDIYNMGQLWDAYKEDGLSRLSKARNFGPNCFLILSKFMGVQLYK